MLRLGSIVISVWALLNLIPSLVILVGTTFLERDAPAITQVLDDEEVETLSMATRASINSVAVFANGMNVAFCLLSLFVTWLGLNRRVIWTFWALLLAFVAALLGGIAADYLVGTVHPEVNLISGAILSVGFGCSAAGIFRRAGRSTAKTTASH